MIDYNGRFCMSSAATAANRAFGVDRGLPFPLADIAEAEAILLVGSNPAATMPPAMQWFDAGRDKGATHIVVDPRRTATANGSSVHLAPLPGTDLALANGLLHLAIRDGLVDADYIARRTRGFAAVRTGVSAYWPDRVERITGIPVTALRETVHTLAEAETAMILTARGAEQHSNGTETAQAYINLALALGLVGRPYSGYGTITGQGNGQGGREHGQKADQLPGYRKLADPAAPGVRRRRLGDRPRRAPPARAVRLRDARPDGHRRRGPGPAGDGLERRRLRPGREPGPRPARRPGPAGRLRHLPVRDRRARRRRPALRPVGGGGGHDDQPGGPGDPAPPGAAPARGRAGRPDRAQGAGRPAGPRPVLQRRPPRGVRRAAPGERGRDRRLRGHQLGADRGGAGRLLAVPERGPPGHAPAVRRRVPHAGRAGAAHPGGAPGPGRDPRCRLPVRADHRPADGPVPERHPDPPGARALPGHRAARGPAAPRPRPPAADRPRRHRPADQPAGRGDLPGDRSAPTSGPTPSSSRSTGAARRRRTP